jgi:methylase of polypeptide subunit release factors
MGEDELEAFISSMHSLDGGTWLAQNYDFPSYQTVLDAGGGSGGVAIGLVEALPHLRVTIAELPLVAKVTKRFVDRAGFTERIQIQEVNLVRQSITGTFDAAILRYVLHTVSSLEDA